MKEKNHFQFKLFAIEIKSSNFLNLFEEETL